MLLKLTLSMALLTMIGMGTSLAQTTTPDVRNPALGDPGAKPVPARHHAPRIRRHLPRPSPSTGVGAAPDRAAAGGGGR